MEYLGAWRTLIHEKYLKSKISCQTPFKNLKNGRVPYLGVELTMLVLKSQRHLVRQSLYE